MQAGMTQWEQHEVSKGLWHNVGVGDGDDSQGCLGISWVLLRMTLSCEGWEEEHSRHAQQHISAGVSAGIIHLQTTSWRQQVRSKPEAANSKSSGLMIVVQLLQAARIQSWFDNWVT